MHSPKTGFMPSVQNATTVLRVSIRLDTDKALEYQTSCQIADV